ncbi:PQQ-binding-like beta-propeller repeat protein [Caulobacter sp.]|uniref:outer membrane protein assembly factor BamB family protein n=1 Tax=Caulobacter sp. TaxID=78 RepID=UPI002B473770|nr:PQQ-binding-like beta-propeller repeat protein [Caulobacter sp.]HJV42613.1 PQQ-binding-like beta-propeller repeat protein [Caulobacter sp.]
MTHIRPAAADHGRKRLLKFGAVLTVAGVTAVSSATLLWAQAAPGGATAGEDKLPAGPGKAAFISSCTACHSAALATSKRRTADEWRDTMKKMVGLGAQLSEQDFGAVHGYLAANFAPVGGAAPAPVAAAAAAPAKAYDRPQGPNQWAAYGGGDANQNYSPLTQITPKNVGKLKPAWTYHYGAGRSDNGDEGLDFRFEVTPILVGGIMYFSTPASPRNPALKASITALRPETGEVIWKYESPLNIHGRGIAYWPGDEKTAPRIYFGTDQGYIRAVDVTTGQLAQGFGRDGQIDAYVGVASEIVGESRRATFTIPNPVTVYKNLIITGARPGEAGPPAPRGDVRAWDARTGRLVWSFHTVPQPGEANADTYKGDEWRDVSGANVWSTMALDAENGIVYAPVGDLNSEAAGSQFYSSSVIALDAATGKLRWFRQIVHRDFWDFDAPTPPVLYEHVAADGRKIPALLLTGKQGLLFMFNRLTGEPINGYEERPVPQPEPELAAQSWPTQPFPIAPGPLSRTQMTRDEIPDLAPGMKAACTKYWDDNNTVSVPLYAPRQSSQHATISYPSPTGGPNWGGGAYNPETGYYFINVQNRAVFRPKASPGAGVGMMNRSARPAGAAPPRPPAGQRPAPPFSFTVKPGLVLSCGATPWGELVAVDVRTQKIAWRVPLGTTEALGEKGAKTGAPNLGGGITTKSGLVFIGAANDRRLRAFDAKTGKTLWEAEMEASAHSTPITYMGADGKQYVVATAGGGTTAGGPQMSDAVVAYRLP